MNKNDIWFYEKVGDLKTCDGRDTCLSKVDIDRLRKIVEFVLRELRSMSEERLYTGVIRGGRVAKLRRVIKNVNYWLLRESELRKEFKYEGIIDIDQYRIDKDQYNNEFRHYILDFTDFSPNYGMKICGRMLLYVEPVVASELIASKIKRYLFDKFPFLVNMRKDKFQTVFDVRGKFWVNERCYFDVGFYRTYVNGSVVRVRNDPKHEEKMEYEQRKLRFFSRSCISKFRNSWFE